MAAVAADPKPSEEWNSPHWHDPAVIDISKYRGLRGDSAKAVAFLELWEPGGAWQLTAIDPDPVIDPTTGKPRNPIETREYTHLGLARDWIEGWQGKRNLYFTVNRSRSGNKKPTKEDISAFVAPHVDLDPPKKAGIDLGTAQTAILTRLQGYRLPPTAIIKSGNGYQGFWRLVEPVPVQDKADIAKFEACNRTLEQELGGAGCFNIDRIMRLPHTTNLPNKAKRELGRVPALAELVAFDSNRVYTLDQFFTPGQSSSSSGTRERNTGTTGKTNRGSGAGAGGLPPIDEPLEAIIKLGHDPKNPQRWTRSDGTLDKNRVVCYVACELTRRGWFDHHIVKTLLNKANRISDHCHITGADNPPRAAWRALEYARAELAKEHPWQLPNPCGRILLLLIGEGAILGWPVYPITYRKWNALLDLARCIAPRKLASRFARFGRR